MIYRHALAAILLLFHGWVGAIDVRFHGPLADRIIAEMHSELRPWSPLENALIRTSIALFAAAQRLFPKRYSYEAIFGVEDR